MIAYLDCFSGISGDMLLGALLDAGIPLETLRDGLTALALPGYTLEAERVTDHGVTGTRALVKLHEADHARRHLADIEALLAAASLPPGARDRASAIFRRLAEAEAAIHGTSIEEVHFHEVGAVDSIVDIVGAAVGFELLGIEELYCSELPLTGGRVKAAHGALPVPAPATLALLQSTAAIWRPVPTEGELVTPTGAAIVSTLARFERPAFNVRQIGYGFGQKRLPWANCLRLLIGEAPSAATARPLPPADTTSVGAHRVQPSPHDETADFERDEVVVIESNIDNMTGEALGWLMDRLLAAGALDVAYAPLHMKKNRPGSLLTVIAAPSDSERLAAIILRESGTLGVRMSRAQRLKAGRREQTIETPLGPARIKLKLDGDLVVGASPEYDDARSLAEAHNLPVEVVMRRIAEAASKHFRLDD